MVPPSTSFLLGKEELRLAEAHSMLKSVKISSLDKETLTFTAEMTSPIDGEMYIVKFTLDGYKELPPLIDFVDPNTGECGTKHAYPADKKSSFFNHEFVCICAKFSRKAYKDCDGPHTDWNYGDWANTQGSYRNLESILRVIYGRISNSETYTGRMSTE